MVVGNLPSSRRRQRLFRRRRNLRLGIGILHPRHNYIGINNPTERLLRIERRIELGSRFLEGGGPREQRCYERLPGSFRWFGRLCYSTVQPQDQPRCTVTFAGRPAIIESRFTEVGLREPDGPPQLRRARLEADHPR